MHKIALFLWSTSLVLAAGCNRRPSTLPPAAPATVQMPPPAPAPAPPPAHAQAKAGPPDRREVEVFGKVALTQQIKAQGHLVVHISEGDCLAPGAQMAASLPAPNGIFAAEFFPRLGSDLTLCGALEEAPGRPVRYYGKAAGKYHVDPTADEVEWKGVSIELKQGPPLKMPTVYNPPQRG